jgi:gas vesicle protein
MSDNGGARAIWFLAGFSVGAVVALLLAPKSGEDTREFIGKKAGEGRDYVTARGKEFRRAAEDLVDKGKDLVAKIPV